MSNNNNNPYEFINFKYAIMISGFKSNQISHENFYNLENKIKIQNLHVIGRQDTIVPLDMSLKFNEYFESPNIIFHNNDHLIPKIDLDLEEKILEFLNKIKK